MGKISEVRWSRGLFRVWLVGACLWMPIGFLSYLAENPPPQAGNWWDSYPEAPADGANSWEASPLADEPQPGRPAGGAGTVLSGDGVLTFDDVPMVYGTELSFEDLIPSGPELRTDDGLSTPSFPQGQVERFAQAATVAIVPPVALLLAFFVLRWVVSGFRAT
jgi:hypothetical protein